MKRGRTSQPDPLPLLAFGAHPDDIEFGCGGIIARETRLGRRAYLVVCSRGEAASHGTPDQRTREAQKGAKQLAATLEFADLGGDAHFEIKVEFAIALARVIRRIKPGIVIAPSTVPNQHPDHAKLGMLVRDAARLARYGGVPELSELPAHAIHSLYFYAVTPEAEPRDISPILVDISEDVGTWKWAMNAHASQTSAREYVELQLTRARLWGLRCGCGYAMAIYPNDPPVIGSLSGIEKTARRF